MIDRIEAKIRQLVDRLKEQQHLQALSQTEHWRALEKQVERRILTDINQLCRLDTNDRDTVMLRAQIEAMRWFLHAAKVDNAIAEGNMKALRSLQEQAKRLHTCGAAQLTADSRTLLDEADKLLRTIQGEP